MKDALQVQVSVGREKICSLTSSWVINIVHLHKLRVIRKYSSVELLELGQAFKQGIKENGGNKL